VRIREESTRVLHDLANVKARTSILSIGAGNPRLEGTSKAARRDAAVVGANGVGEGETGRPGAALGCFVDVCGG
jgi:hypothetical protein